MYIDANIFILANAATDEKGENAANILEQVMNGKKAITSCLTLDEVMWWFLKNGKEDLRSVVEEIYSLENLEVKENPPLVPLDALELIEKYDLKPRDAFHVATMKRFGQKEIASDDSNFDRIDGIKRIAL